MNVFGIKLVGLTPDTGRKLLLTLAFVLVLVVLRAIAAFIIRMLVEGHGNERREGARFWSQQIIALVTAALLIIGIVSIWFDDPGRLATVAGLVTAGVAIALQRVITAFAAYLTILRGRVFTVGDRITIGGVRGDVVSLGFMQTTVLEMGEPPPVQNAPPAVWVSARQYTGRLVRVTNDKIFDMPVYNYTREFPFLWEEMHIPIPYDADRNRAEQILLGAAQRQTDSLVEEAKQAFSRVTDRYYVPGHVDFTPHVYWHLTDNWLQMTIRFVVPERATRGIKDAMSREIIAGLDAAGIGIASGTYDIVGVPPITVHMARTPAPA